MVRGHNLRGELAPRGAVGVLALALARCGGRGAVRRRFDGGRAGCRVPGRGERGDEGGVDAFLAGEEGEAG